MRKQLNEFDAALDSYLARLAGDAVETTAHKSDAVRVHYASPAAGIALPAGQAIVTGALIGVAVGAVAYQLQWSKPLAWGLIAWLIVQCLAWLFLLHDWRSVTHKLESVTRRDLDGDSIIGPPAPPIVQRVKIELVEGNHTRYIDLPCSDEQLLELARLLVDGRTLTQANFTGSGKPFDRAQFEEIKAELIKRGLAVLNSPGTPARGVTLTASGRACFQHIVDNPPTLSEDD